MKFIFNYSKLIISSFFWVILILTWYIYSGFMPSYQLPSPVMVITAMLNIVVDVDLIKQIGLSLFHIITAILISFLVGSCLALLPFYNAHFKHFIDHRLTPFLNSFSGVGWLFIAILWFGINSFTVIFAVTMVLIPFAIINLRTGILEMDSEILELGKSLTRKSKKLFFNLAAPMLFPYGFATLRTSFGVSWKVVLTAELFGGAGGMGYILNKSRQEFETEMIFAVIAFIIAFVIIAEVIFFSPIQKHLDKRYIRD